jgi:hypothetical protein
VQSKRRYTADAQAPAGPGTGYRHLCIGVINCRKNVARTKTISLTFCRQGHPPRRSMQQAHAKPIFEARYKLGNSRWRDAKVPRSSGKAPSLDYLNEGAHIAHGAHSGLQFLNLIPKRGIICWW